MTDTCLPLFLNPAAGRGRGRKNASAIQNLLTQQGVQTTLIQSNAIGEMEEQILAHASSRSTPILVAGGDGSVNEAINGILRARSDIPFGLIPIGTGNDFAKSCQIPMKWDTAAMQLAKRINTAVAPKRIDAGRVNKKFFANAVGIGFDAKINRIASEYRWPIGDLVYLVAVFRGIWDGVITAPVKMTDGSNIYSGPMTLVSVSNGPWVGGMFYIAPEAKTDDGKLDLIFAAPMTRLRVLKLLPKIIQGTHVADPDITCKKIESLELIAERPLPCHVDGEIQPLQTEFRIEIHRNALSVI